MAILEAIVGPVSKLLDKIIPDPEARDRAKLELIKLQGDQEMAAIGVQMQAIIAEAQSSDPWTSRANLRGSISIRATHLGRSNHRRLPVEVCAMSSKPRAATQNG